MIFDPVEGEIEWMVNDKSEAKYLSTIFNELPIPWVPMLMFYNTGDTVQWL